MKTKYSQSSTVYSNCVQQSFLKSVWLNSHEIINVQQKQSDTLDTNSSVDFSLSPFECEPLGSCMAFNKETYVIAETHS